jgi:hypothetical protein
MGGGEKKNEKKKRGVGFREKRGIRKERKKKKLKGKKLNWFYLYVLFVWCKV